MNTYHTSFIVSDVVRGIDRGRTNDIVATVQTTLDEWVEDAWTWTRRLSGDTVEVVSRFRATDDLVANNAVVAAANALHLPYDTLTVIEKRGK